MLRQLATPPTCGTTTVTSPPSGGLRVLIGGSPLDRLLPVIREQVRAPVTDGTGLVGLFDLVLEFTPERSRRSDATEPPPPLATALGQQLGLRLDQQRGPVPIVVIDSVSRPTPD